MTFISITASDKNTSESMSATFNTTDRTTFKESVEEWEQEIPYRRFTLSSFDYIEDYLWDIQETLEELDVEMI